MNEDQVNAQLRLNAKIAAREEAESAMTSALQKATEALQTETDGILGNINLMLKRQLQYKQSIATLEKEHAVTKNNIKQAQERLEQQKKREKELETALENEIEAVKKRHAELTKKGKKRTDSENAELKELDNRTDQKRKAWQQSKLKSGQMEANIVKLTGAYKAQENKLKVLPWERLAASVSDVSKSLNKAVESINKTQQQFGVVAGQALGMQLSNSISSFTSYIDAAASGFTKFGVTAEQISATQASFQAEFGQILTGEAATDIAQQARTMGTTAEQLAMARRAFMTNTLGDVTQAKQQQDKFIAEFAKKGISSKVAFELIGKNSEILARNGTRFADSFIRAAAAAKKIGVDLGRIDQIGDNIIGDFEGFLEKQAELGAMGFNLDAQRLGELAESGDTGALFNELRSQLSNTGKDITKLRRSEQLAISSAFGISMGDLQRMIGKESGSGEKTVEQLQSDSNGLLSRMASAMDVFSKILSTSSLLTNGLLGIIALSSSITAGATVATATSLVTLLAPIVGPILGIVAIIGLLYAGFKWLFGKKESKPATRGDDVFSKSMSRPGYGARTLVTPSGAIALNNKDNVIAYANDLRSGNNGTEIKPEGYYKQMGLNVADTGMAAGAAFANNGVKRAATGAFTGMSRLGLMNDFVKKYLFGNKALFDLQKGALGVPLLGQILSAAMAGSEEYQNSGSITRALGRGTFAGVGSLLGETAGAATMNPAIAWAGGIGGALAGEETFDKIFTPKAPPAPSSPPTLRAAPESSAVAMNMDTSRLEQRMEGIVRALSGLQINLDGNKVGQALIASEQRAATSGVFGASRY